MILVGESDATTPSLWGGMCLPEICSTDSIKLILNSLLKQYNVPLEVASVENNFPNQQYPYERFFFFTLFMFTLLFILVLLSSLSKTVGKHQILSAFSMQNSLKIFKYRDNPLNTLNGVRALSMLWVIIGHEFAFMIQFSENVLTISNQLEKSYFLVIEAGVFAVDTFFFIGGFLVAYSLLKQENKTFWKYPLGIVNRWLRLVPAYFAAIMFFYSILIHLGEGPVWSQVEGLTSNCHRLWSPLLFVDNLVDNGATQCMGWGWYLQNDMQIFLYCMVLLLVYEWKSMAGYVMIVWSILASFFYNMYYVSENHVHTLIHTADLGLQGNYQQDIYIKPWARCPPYLYGLLLGIMYTNFLLEEKKAESDHIFVKLKKAMQKNRILQWSIELSGVFLGTFICFIPRTGQNEHNWSQLAHSLYLTYGKTGFVVAVSLIVLPSLLGVNSFVRFILDTKLFNFIGKVSYCTYLVHLIFITYWMYAQFTNFYFEPIATYVIFLTTSIASIAFGFILSILVEIPFSRFQKQLMGKLLHRKEENT